MYIHMMMVNSKHVQEDEFDTHDVTFFFVADRSVFIEKKLYRCV